MKRANHGHVVTISSVAGMLSVPGQVDYNASKFAAFAIDEGLRYELRNSNSKVKTTCICPYFVNTGMFEGAKTKWPTIIPMLEVDWICKRTVDAIRQEEKVVVTPYIISLSFGLRNQVPVTLFDYIQDFFGSLDAVGEIHTT